MYSSMTLISVLVLLMFFSGESVGLTCNPGETLMDVYCKGDPTEAVTECAVGLGDERLAAIELKTIINGDCSPGTYNFHFNIITVVGDLCEAILSVCLEKVCVEQQLTTSPCDGTVGFMECYFALPPGIVGTLISVAIAANPTSSECNPLGFGINPPGYPMTAPGIYGYDSDSMYVNSGCTAEFTGCFSDYICSEGEIRTIVCQSPNTPFGYKACSVQDGDKIIRDAWLATPSSPVPCHHFDGHYPYYTGPAGAWGYNDNILWVSGGCSGIFGVCLDRGCPGGDTATINCTSTPGGLFECALSQRKILYGDLLFLSPDSTTCLNQGLGQYDPTIHTSSTGMFGWVYDTLWVANGCDGRFKLCYSGPCTVSGDPHFITHDEKHYSFQGDCTYELVTDQDTFFVYGDFFKCGKNGRRSCLHSLFIRFMSHNVTLMRTGTIFVDGNDITSALPFDTTDGVIHIERVWTWVRVELANWVYIMWDQAKKAEIYLPITFQGVTMGLCGTYDINIHNDFTKPNGQVVPNPNEFGNSWEVPYSCPSNQMG